MAEDETGQTPAETSRPVGPSLAGPTASPPDRVIPVERPPFRRLRVYAFDPSLSTQLENAVVNTVTVKIPWEFDPETNYLPPGPVGEYLEVVDFDPASNCFYAPVNLDHPYLLAQDGLDPSEGNPQFHQQMVYAVAMTTIRNFERALGRAAFWAPHQRRYYYQGKPRSEAYVQRLRIYPHALREANAYYSPQKKALLFGYFPATPVSGRTHLPGGTVFTCLSHDIIAHETTHALLDGLHRRYNEPTNPDMLAFHEAFADIVALFQHFSFPDVLRHQLAKTRGDLASENLLAQLAQEFGQATGAHGALRDALGEYVDGKWQPKPADPTLMQKTFEPHDRGSLLVAGIFDAFVSIYKSRIADLVRVATSGSGILPAGQLHPDLVNRLAGEAAKSAQHILTMCIRALDYCTPVDLTFGEYLRALITADFDLVRDDDLGYRLAVIEAFRRRGIYPRNVRSLSVDSLRWQAPGGQKFGQTFTSFLEAHRRQLQEWSLSSNREKIYYESQEMRGELHNRLAAEIQVLPGFMKNRPFEVHSLRPARRVGPDGQILTDLVIEITQSRPGYFDEQRQREVDEKLQRGADSDQVFRRAPRADFIFRGGSTLLVDLETSQVRYAIYKDIQNNNRLARQRTFLKGDTDTSLRATYFGHLARSESGEPFALLHRSVEKEELI